jgi:aquaporin Z
MTNRDWIRSIIIEFLGPFALCFMGIGAIIQTQGNDLVAIALAHGLGIGLIVAAGAHVSGGVLNPALTLGLWAARRMDTAKAVVYIVAQCLGGIAACGALTLVYRDVDRNAVNLGLPAIGHAIRDPTFELSAGNALVMEFILTFFLMFVVFGTAIDGGSVGKAIAPLAIGLTITMDIFAGGAVSGAAMNPARWIGPAVVQGDFGDFWIWIVGPVLGAVVAALVYNEVILVENWSVGTQEFDLEVAEEGPPPAQQPVRSRRAVRRGRR